MGLLDSILKEAVPAGNLAKPAMLAVGAMLVEHMLSPSAQASGTAAPAATQQADATGGNLIGALGGILDKLQAAGHGDTVNSWVGTGQNASIHPDHLGSALGSELIAALTQQTGLNQQDLLNQLSQALPGLIDKLTPNGRLPTLQEAAALLQR